MVDHDGSYTVTENGVFFVYGLQDIKSFVYFWLIYFIINHINEYVLIGDGTYSGKCFVDDGYGFRKNREDGEKNAE